MSEWRRIAEKLGALSRMDPQLAAFGARSHGYHFGPEVDETALATAEHRIGASLPPELRSFYLTLGDGGAGPGLGLYAYAELKGLRADRAFAGVEALRERYSKGEKDGYFEVPRGALSGLVAIAHEGCGHQTCLVTSGDSRGTVIHVSADGFVSKGAPSLIAHYDRWLDDEIAVFDATRSAMDSAMTLSEISSMLVERFHRWGAGDIIASIANIAKPESLFGTEGTRIYHGATQTPWYEKALADWRRDHRAGSGLLEVEGVASGAPTSHEPQRVSHPKFGVGVVIARDGSGELAKLEVRFADGVRKLQAKFVTIIE